jgi:F-type H+-transporting ATPase subunit delta
MPAPMSGSSRRALDAARADLDDLLGRGDVDAAQVSDELFGVVRVLDEQVRLRRVLSDPAQPAQRRAELARALFGRRVGAPALAVVERAVSSRWSRVRDLGDALEVLAVSSEVEAAARAGRLDELEDELFRFGRIVAAAPALRTALSDRAVSGERKRELVRTLLENRATESTGRLLGHLVASSRSDSFEEGLETYAGIAASRRARLVGLVTVAVAMTEEQKQRLAAALRSIYDREVHLNIQVDPHVVGGIRVQVGDEVVDGTVAQRLSDARRRLVG